MRYNTHIEDFGVYPGRAGLRKDVIFIRSTDKRVLRTRTLIRRAFEEMICEPKGRRICVSELADHAGINRKTFYLHYSTIEEFLDSVADDIVDAYTREMDKLPLPIRMEDQTRVFFDFYCSQPPYVQELMTNPDYNYIADRINKKGIARNRKRFDALREYPDEIRELVSAYSVSSTLGLFRHWVNSGKQLTVTELTEIASTLVASGFDGYLKRGSAESSISAEV